MNIVMKFLLLAPSIEMIFFTIVTWFSNVFYRDFFFCNFFGFQCSLHTLKCHPITCIHWAASFISMLIGTVYPIIIKIMVNAIDRK